MKVDLLSKKGCSICSQARQVLEDLRSELDLDLSEIDTEADSFLYARHRYDLPVIRLDGRIVSRRTGDPAEISRRLRHAHRMKVGRQVERHVTSGSENRRVVKVNMADVAQGTSIRPHAPTTLFPTPTVPATGSHRPVVKVSLAEVAGGGKAAAEVPSPMGRQPAKEKKEPKGRRLPPLQPPSEGTVFPVSGYPGAKLQRKLLRIEGVEEVTSGSLAALISVKGSPDALEKVSRELAEVGASKAPASSAIKPLVLAFIALVLGVASGWLRESGGLPFIPWLFAAGAAALPLLVVEARWLLRDLPLLGALPFLSSALLLVFGLLLGASHPVELAAAPGFALLVGLIFVILTRGRVQTHLRFMEGGPESPEPGTKVSLEAGAVIPADGRLETPCIVDEGPIGGDDDAERQIGEEVFAGSIAREEAAMVVTSSQSRRAQARASTERSLTSRRQGKMDGLLSTVFPIAALAGAVVAWMFQGPLAAAAALGAVAPLALAFAGSLSEASALTSALRRGVGASSAEVLLRAGRIRSVVLGKRSVLEKGKPAFLGMRLRQNQDATRILELAASAEAGLDHPIARSILDHAAQLGIHPRPTSEREFLPGAGVEAVVGATRIVLGSPALLSEKGVDCTAFHQVILELGRRGSTPIIVSVDGEAVGVLEIGGFPAEAARQAIGSLELRDIDIRVATGDSTATAKWLAEILGLEPSRVAGDLRREEKRGVLEEMDRPVLLAGGITALRDAAEGADLALETASGPGDAGGGGAAFLIRPDPRGVVELIRTGRAARRARSLGVAVALGGSALVLALAMTGATGPLGATLLSLLATVASLGIAASPWISIR